MGNGNRKAQYKRRKERLKSRPPKQKEKFQLIDGKLDLLSGGGMQTTQRIFDRRSD